VRVSSIDLLEMDFRLDEVASSPGTFSIAFWSSNTFDKNFDTGGHEGWLSLRDVYISAGLVCAAIISPAIGMRSGISCR
jgi:hypothetical protein